MRTINEIMSDIFDGELYDQEDVNACTLYSVKATDIQRAMEEYAKEQCVAFLKDIREYVEDLEGKDPLDEAMTCEEYYEIFINT